MHNETGTAVPLIEDFDDGIDAIELLILSFGFEDLELIRTGMTPESARPVWTPSVVGTGAPPPA